MVIASRSRRHRVVGPAVAGLDEIVGSMSISEGATAKEGVVVPGSQYGAANRADLTRNEGGQSMVELAYNGNGDPFEVPEKVTGWRVRG